MEKARELLSKHLYNHGGDGLGISDGKVYMAVLDAIQEALNIPCVIVPVCPECGCNKLQHNYGKHHSCLNAYCNWQGQTEL
jgi:hypothetical protein